MLQECEINLTCFQSETILDDNDVVRCVRRPIPFFVVPNLDAISIASCLQVPHYFKEILLFQPHFLLP
jgi:hypothetical protein